MQLIVAAIWARARDLILRPGATWDVIAHEVHDAQQLMLGWVLPLAAVPALARLVGGLLFGYLPFARLLSHVIGLYVVEVATILAIAWFVAWLAPRFGGQNRFERALAWAGFAATPTLLAGALHLVPPLAILQWVGSLYGLYLGYLGLAPMLRSRPEQSLPFMAVVVAILVVAALALRPLLAVVLR